MALWKRSLDPFIKTCSVNSSSFLPIILDIPKCPISIDTALYLPTSGKDTEFIEALSMLKLFIGDMLDKYKDPIFFIKGDSNVNPKNKSRSLLLKLVQQEYNLQRLQLQHNSYHHFVGHGESDSEIDIIMYSGSPFAQENLLSIFCKLEYPQIDSCHDIIETEICLLMVPEPIPIKIEKAPRMFIKREKILWTAEGIERYKDIVAPHLRNIRDSWPASSSKSAVSVLLQSSYDTLSSSASDTNISVDLLKKNTPKKIRTPPAISHSLKYLENARLNLRSIQNLSSATSFDISEAEKMLSNAKSKYRCTVRYTNHSKSYKRDQGLDDILTSNPSKVFSFVRTCKSSGFSQIQKLQVGNTSYEGSDVPDGFFESMTKLKSCDYEDLRTNPFLKDQLEDYDHIMKLNGEVRNIPAMSRKTSDSILKRLRKDVRDIYNITASHFLNAGEEGLIHYNFLLNTIINETENATIEEFNTAHGLIIFKGHGKDKTSDRAYRTISSCPMLAKSLDLYLRDLFINDLNLLQAPTQYLGAGSSHELASLLVTETIQHSLYVSDKPIFLLMLDAQSAFDKVIPQILVRRLFFSGISGAALNFINNRITSRSTVYEWDSNFMGPAKDKSGVKQGGINSGDLYKSYNNEQFISAQSSNQGVDIISGIISGAGQADDALLSSNDIFSLQNLLFLTIEYCKKYNVLLCPEKTKLLGIASKKNKFILDYQMAMNPINMEGVGIDFVESAEHVGVIRSVDGNMPNLLNRIQCHQKAMGAVLSVGIGRGHSGNPAAGLRVEKLYGCPVLMSGLASLYMKETEIKILDTHYKTTLERIQKLHCKTPRSYVFFLAGSLPAKAILHLRQLSLFIMICHLPEDPLNVHARCVLKANCPPKSWFAQIN